MASSTILMELNSHVIKRFPTISQHRFVFTVNSLHLRILNYWLVIPLADIVLQKITEILIHVLFWDFILSLTPVLFIKMS